METNQDQTTHNTENLKEIPKWTRKYAQNRTLPSLIALVIFMALFGGISIPSYLGAKAFTTGHMILFGICVFISAISMICVFIISVPKFGGKLFEYIYQRVYARQGSVSIPVPQTMKKPKWLCYVVAIVFSSCVLASVFLGLKGFFSIEYMQPISALYFVPFTLFLYFLQRPIVSPIALLWPALYAVHAILIVIGVPILFTENLIGLNMILPVFGYGSLTYIIGHLYSRYALKKLKDITHLQGNDANEN